MHRLLIRCGTMYRNPMKLMGTIPTDLPKHIHSSFGRIMKQVQISDDYEDIPTYSEQTKRLERKMFVNYMEQELDCSSATAENIWLKNPNIRDTFLNILKRNVDLLTLKGLTKSVIRDNPSLLTLPNSTLSARLKILQSMNPNDIGDFVPLAIIPDKQLCEIKKIAENEDRKVLGMHRIYHLSKVLETEPYIISKFVSRKPSVLAKSLDTIHDRIKILLKCKPPPEIAERLRLIECSTNEFETRMAMATERNQILRGRSVQMYYADRLNCEIAQIEEILKQHPSIGRFTLILVDQKIDYLLNVAGFKGSDILKFPRVLYVPLELLKKRFAELQSHGCGHNRMLGSIYQSQRGYKEFLKRQKGPPKDGPLVKL